MTTTSDSTPSAKSHTTSSSRSGHAPGTPKPPIDPPRRRSSLAFSRALAEHSPSLQAPVDHANSQPLFSRTPSNVGRKRRMGIPLHRSTATPGHVAQMQKIFSNAKASLQLDMRYAASPAGSIGSRLPPSDSRENLGHSAPERGDAERISMRQAEAWRYSSVPFLLSSPDVDVREPFPEQLPLLPGFGGEDTNQSKVFVAEPISSGFTSPAGRDGKDEPMGDVHLLATALGSSPPARTYIVRRPSSVGSQQSDDGLDYLRPLVTTELEQPLTNLRVGKVTEHELEDDDLQESPIVTHLKRLSGGKVSGPHRPASPGSEIFLSTPAKAAAESAKAKRGQLRDNLRSSSDKENVDPTTRDSDNALEQDGISYACPNPAVHCGVPIALCPDPTLHYRSNTPSVLGTPGIQITPSPNMVAYGASPSPLRASLQVPPAYMQRVSASGSPMPVLKMKSPPPSPGPSAFSPRQSYFSHAKHLHQRPLPPLQRPSNVLSRGPSDADHFQPGWYYATDPPAQTKKHASLTYAFSTAAAKVGGSSSAPDSRIRDSYRTDTLTPLARPATRFRKNGIGALASRGVSKYYSKPGGPDESACLSRPESRVMPPATRMSRSPRFMSSPPRPINGMVGMAPPKRRRTKHTRKGEFEIVEDDEFASGVRSKVASVLEADEDGSVMEVDDDIRDAVRMSIVGLPGNGSDAGESRRKVMELSPNVTPFRKGMGPRKKRRSSYWDGDLEGVRLSPAGREVRTSPIKRIEEMEGRDEEGQQMSFNAEDLSGEVQRAGEEMERRLSQASGIGEGQEIGGIGEETMEID